MDTSRSQPCMCKLVNCTINTQLRFRGRCLSVLVTILLWLSFIQTKAFSEALKDGGVILSEPKKVIPPETFYLGK